MDVTLSNCAIVDNTATSHGGAIRALMRAGSTLRLLGCTLAGNVANVNQSNGNYVGGALYAPLEGGSPWHCLHILFATGRCTVAQSMPGLSEP